VLAIQATRPIVIHAPDIFGLGAPDVFSLGQQKEDEPKRDRRADLYVGLALFFGWATLMGVLFTRAKQAGRL
jgi:hypothetical protein